MNTEMTDKDAKQPTAGWVCYDGECAFCVRWLRRTESHLLRRGFDFVPLQATWVRAKLNVPEVELLNEMRVILPDNRILGGSDAVVVLARYIWWLWPLWFASKIPGAMPLLRAGYRFIAKNRHCENDKCEIRKGIKP